ncbi:adenylyl-sulfate kinase [Hafnia alvei]|uniref:adenylyl-sulfate kinase n=1 Tax=Hafnia alvei TaxID=569 RepID=UPI001D10A9E0
MTDINLLQPATESNASNPDIVWHEHAVNRESREKLHGHQGAVIWFTGLSGSGKSSIAGALEQALHQLGVSTYLLDGDNVRHGLSRDLDFSDDDRIENIRRVGEVAKLMQDAGLLVLTAFISPHRHERQMVRELLPEGRFIEVFVDTPLAVCEQRDPKGLYKKARAGEIKNFTGISSVYEPPVQPEIHLNGEQLVTNLVAQMLDVLRHHAIIKP